MSTSTTLAIFALIIAASCAWMVYLAIIIDRQTEVIRTSISEVLGWLEAQEQVNEAQTEINNKAVERMDALETRLPDFDWEDPNER